MRSLLEQPGRLKDLRRWAYERYQALPWPSRSEEEWRRTDPETFAIPPLDPEPMAEGLEIGKGTVPESALQSGVILTDLNSALREHPDLVEKHLFQTGSPAGLEKFVWLHQALCAQGLFCYVPDGVRVEVPLRSWIEVSKSGGIVFPHVLLVVGEESELTLIDERRPGAAAKREEAPLLSDEMVEIALKPRAVLRYIHLQRWRRSVAELFTQRTQVDREAQLLNITVCLGGRLTKANMETVLEGASARAELLAILFGSGNQHYDFHTLQDHRAQATFSDLLYKGVLKDQANSIYRGLIRISKEAQKANAYQANRNLLLSQGATADSIPMLEIEADDVRCTHGVAVGPVDEEQLFYLMSRGLSPEESERLIVEGFFDPVFQRIPTPGLREELLAEVLERLSETS